MPIRKGTCVQWSWGNGTATGKVSEVHHVPITRTIKGSEITRKGTGKCPAYVIEQEDGDMILKLRSEVTRRDTG